MDDRQLLEAAAKAAGMFVLPKPWPDKDGWFFCEQNGNPALHFRCFDKITTNHRPWMPLTDDGDALRLAVKLGITFRKFGHIVTAVGKTQCDEYIDADPYAATRRAIVRAAAEMGK